MDELVKTHLSSLVLSLTLMVSLAGRAVEIEYIAPERSQALADQFASAHLNEADKQILAKKKTWSCSMYGVRTRMQVQKADKLYDWSSNWKNMGTHPVTRYAVESTTGSLVGMTDRLMDEVRMTSNGQLVSRLSTRGTTPAVLAYTVCQANESPTP